jgi:hypothetical protein
MDTGSTFIVVVLLEEAAVTSAVTTARNNPRLVYLAHRWARPADQISIAGCTQSPETPLPTVFLVL